MTQQQLYMALTDEQKQQSDLLEDNDYRVYLLNGMAKFAAKLRIGQMVASI